MKHRLRDRSQKQEKKQALQNDPYKLSIHTSSNFNKSDSGSKRLNISRMLENSRKKISMRKASELFQSGGIRPQSTKNLKRNQVIEFDNIKWISIISAYDPSRLKNVSVSKKSCQKFLSSNQQNIKSDSRNLLYFNDLIKNFKSWHNKIQMQYCYIMNKFLRQRQSANITLVQLRPKLDQVISQTLRMQQNLQDCLKSYQNHEFRQLVEKYYISLVQCQKIEKIIQSVDKSKNKIVNLYKKFDDDRKIEQKITRVKNQGISKVKQIASDYEVQIESKIMDRIQDAINQIAQKSGQAYRKIKGVKHLIEKFKNTEHQSQQMGKIDIEAINFMGKVCKQICYQAEAFEQFSSKFMVDGGIINQDLQKIIKKYEQQVLYQRKKAIDLQMKFLNIIFCETIKKLKENSKISAVYENADSHNEEYKKILRMIQDIADCIRDQDKRISLQRLIKETRTILDRLYQDLKFLKQNKKFEEIDTEEGLISILEVSKLIKEYKDKILLVRKKFESAHRQVQLSPIKVQSIGNDNETQFISLVIGLSKKINNSGLKGKLQKEACFISINEGLGLVQMAKQIDKENILTEITSISNQFLELQGKNILEKYFGPLKLQNLIFKESIVMVELKNISQKTKQKNIIPQLTQLLSKRNQWIQKHKKISPQMKRYFERILGFTLVKGLKSQDIKEIENPQGMAFPTKQNQIQGLKSKAKYRQVLFDLIQESAIQTTKSLITQNTDQKSQQKTKNRRVLKSSKTKFNFYISDVLERNIATINNFVNSFIKISEIKKNINSESYLAKEYFFEFSQKLFTEVFLKQVEKCQTKSSNQIIKNLLKELIQISYDRFLSLTRKIIQEENQWKDNQKKKKSQSQLNLNKTPIYLQKVIDILQFYKSKTQSLNEVTKQALESLDKPVQNVQNSHEQIDEYFRLSVYAKVINSLVKYCKDTDQKVHVVLDSNKSPIAVIDPKENVLRQIFPGLKKGKELSLNQIQKLLFHEAKIGIQLKKKNQKNQAKKQTLTKEKSKSKKKQSDMEEQILDEDQGDIKDDMQEQYPADEDIEQIQDNDEIPQDDDGMTEQLGDEIQQQQPEEEMAEDFQAPQDQIEQEKVEQEQALQDLIEQSQNLGKSKGKSSHNNKKIKTNNEIDQFDQYEWEQDNQKTKKLAKNKNGDSKLKQKQLKQKQEQYKIKKLEEQKKQQQKKQELQKQKRMKKQHIVSSQTQAPKKILLNSVYEVLSFITSLYQLKKLITYVSSFEENYFKNFIDWAKIQHYYNDHNSLIEELDKKQIQKYVKNLQDDVEIRLKTQFKSEPNVFNEIKNLDMIKKIKKHLLLLKNGNWEALQNILSQNHVSYNILKSSNTVLYIWIKQSTQDFDYIGSVHGYLTKNMKCYERSQFDLKGFTEKCCTMGSHESKQHSFICVSYEVKAETTLVGKFAQIEQSYQKLIQFNNDFSNGAKDIINKFDFCLELYKKALEIKQKVTLDLNWYADKIKFLQKYGTDEFYPLTYMNFIKENIKTVIKKVKSLESKLYNLSFKCEKNNLFQCFEEICQLYGQQIEKKVFISTGQSKFITVLFDKTTVKENEEKIKKILTSKPNNVQEEAQKILLSLVYGQQYQQTTQISENQIIKNVQRIDFISSELLLEIVSTLRIDHSYVLIKNKNFEFFNIKKTKQQCISGFFQKVAKSIMESKQASNIFSNTQFPESLKELSNTKNTKDSSVYQRVFSKQSLQKLIKYEIKNEKLFTQTKIIVNEQLFMFDKVWLQQSVKLMKEIVQCSNGNKNQTNKILGNLKKLRPCHFIYHKRFSNEKQSQVLKLWTQHLSNLQNILLNGKNTKNKKSWILLLNSVSENFNDQFINEVNNNIQTIKSLLQKENISSSLEDISKQVKKIFEWLIQKDKQQGKIQFSVITLSKQREIIYFDCNISGFSEDYFNQNFAFVESINLELKEFLSKQLISNMSLDKHDEIRNNFKLKKNDKIYELETEKLSSSVLQFVTSILGQQNKLKRNKIARQIVRVFNKIYYLSRTTQSLNFKQQSRLLQSLQKDFRKQLENLKLVYTFRTFLSTFNKTLLKNSQITQNILQALEKSLKQNSKIPQQQIQEILIKLEKVKINNKTSSIDSYKPFYSWFYQTVMSIMKLPFYNIISHVQVNQKSRKTLTSFLGVIVTQKSTKPGQENEQLQTLMKEIFLYTQHKPIYLKQNDLTVELLKQPVFVSLQTVVNGLQLKEIVGYLNQNCEEDQKDSQKMLYLRVDEIHTSKQNDNEERILLKIIPLLDFVKQNEQQFNIHVTEQNLTVEIEFNVIYAQKNISNTQKDVTKSSIPLNGSLVDSFEKVYIGKKLRLQKIKSWLYSFYLKRKNQIQVENKEKMIEEFFNGFVQYFMTTVAKQSRDVVKKIISKIELTSVLGQKSKSSNNEKLYLETSLKLLETCKKELQKFKINEYEKKLSLQKHYDRDIVKLIQNFEHRLHEELINAETEIKQKMEKKIGGLAHDKVNEIYISFKQRKQKQEKQIAAKNQEDQQKQNDQENKDLQKSAQLLNTNRQSQKIQSMQKIREETNKVQNKIQEQIEEISKLKETNFEEYLMKKIELLFNSLNQQKILYIENQIKEKFDEKLKQITEKQEKDSFGKLKKKVHQSLKIKEKHDEIETINHQRLMFLYFMLQKNETCYVQLFLNQK